MFKLLYFFLLNVAFFGLCHKEHVKKHEKAIFSVWPPLPAFSKRFCKPVWLLFAVLQLVLKISYSFPENIKHIRAAGSTTAEMTDLTFFSIVLLNNARTMLLVRFSSVASDFVGVSTWPRYSRDSRALLLSVSMFLVVWASPCASSEPVPLLFKLFTLVLYIILYFA